METIIDGLLRKCFGSEAERVLACRILCLVFIQVHDVWM